MLTANGAGRWMLRSTVSIMDLVGVTSIHAEYWVVTLDMKGEAIASVGVVTEQAAAFRGISISVDAIRSTLFGRSSAVSESFGPVVAVTEDLCPNIKERHGVSAPRSLPTPDWAAGL